MLWRFARPADINFKAPRLDYSQEKYQRWLSQDKLSGLCRFVSQTPEKKDYSVFEAYKLYAQKSQKRLIFHTLALNGFGSPQQELLWKSFLDLSNKPDAEVFLLTNGPGFTNSDMMPAWVGRIVGHYFLNSVYDTLYDTKIKSFAYPAWLHSKVYFFDNLATAIGSFNFDETGLVWTESSLICLDEDLAEQVIHMFKKDLEASYVLGVPK